jgi:hypothetical protein
MKSNSAGDVLTFLRLLNDCSCRGVNLNKQKLSPFLCAQNRKELNYTCVLPHVSKKGIRPVGNLKIEIILHILEKV